jgi:pSer/pThr/pTyr-binding forkhead associated (FHA) protein
MASRECPNCKAKLDPAYLFCPECGGPVPAPEPEPAPAPRRAEAPAPRAAPHVASEPAWAEKPPAKAAPAPAPEPEPATLEAARRTPTRKAPPETAPAKAGSTRSRFKIVRLARGGGQSVEYAIPEDGIEIGRNGTGLSFPDDETVSPRHVEVKVVGPHVEVEDLGSLNGVYVRLKAECKLAEGDSFVLGDSVFRVSLKPGRFDPTEYRLYAAPLEKSVLATVSRILPNGREGEVYAVRGLPFVFGREEGDVRCGADRFMSRKHAALQNTAQGIVLVDLKSRNGTYVRRRGTLSLSEGDVFMVGRQLLRVEAVAS